jgi:hypothetical protein
MATRDMAALGVEGRRRARFTFLVRRARKTVEGGPPLTAAEWRELAAIYSQAADEVSPGQRGVPPAVQPPQAGR